MSTAGNPSNAWHLVVETHSISSIPVWGRFATNLEMQLDGLKTMTVQVNQAVLLSIGLGHPDWPYISSWKHVPGTMLPTKRQKKKMFQGPGVIDVTQIPDLS